MASFSQQPPSSFGAYFKKLREDANFSLEKLSEKSKIPKRHLEHLEEEQFEKLPPAVYVRGFITKCCALFGRDNKENEMILLRMFCDQARFAERSQGGAGQKRLHRFVVTPRHLALLGVVLFFLLTGAYLVLKFTPFLFAPEISLVRPQGENMVVNFSRMSVAGRVRSASLLTLNNERLYIGKKGLFEQEVQLEEGVNRFVFEAKNFFGRKAEVVRRVVYIRNEN